MEQAWSAQHLADEIAVRAREAGVDDETILAHLQAAAEALRGTDMNIITERQPNGQWTAIDADSYDGPGSPVGWGATEDAAIADLREQVALMESKQ